MSICLCVSQASIFFETVVADALMAEAVRKEAFCAPFYNKNDRFTKTGSRLGTNIGKAAPKRGEMRFPAQAADPVERFKNGWYDCESAAAFILNIPSRFDFEVALHEARAEGTISSPEDMSNLMVTAWRGAKHKKRAPFSHYENPIICQGRLGTNTRQRLHKTQHLASSVFVVQGATAMRCR